MYYYCNYFHLQIWALCFLCLVLTSIAVLCIETLPALRVPLEDSRSSEPDLEGTTAQDVEHYANYSSKTHNNTGLVLDQFTMNEKARKLFTTEPHPVLEVIDSFCTCFFTIEFVARLAVAPDKIKFIKSLMNILDVLCVLPMWIKYILQIYEIRIDGSEKSLVGLYFVIMALRVLRICRVLRMARHYTGVKILLLALNASLRELGMLLIFITIVMLIFSVVIYYAEFTVPDTFHSIPEGFWWVIITLTTVGYGDMFPKSVPGYFIGSLCALTGILATGLPVPIIANNFNLYYTHAQLKEAVANRRGVIPAKEIDLNSASPKGMNFPRIGSKRQKAGSGPGKESGI